MEDWSRRAQYTGWADFAVQDVRSIQTRNAHKRYLDKIGAQLAENDTDLPCPMCWIFGRGESQMKPIPAPTEFDPEDFDPADFDHEKCVVCSHVVSSKAL